MDRLKKRSDFIKIAREHKQVRPAVILQARSRKQNEMEYSRPRVGFTVTKKIGTAVVRNRVRRRLKEALRLLECEVKEQGIQNCFLLNTDYVLIGRAATKNIPFHNIQIQFKSAFYAIASSAKHQKIRDQ